VEDSHVYARLTVHEFALEVMMANWVAGMPADHAEQFLADFCDRARKPWIAGKPAVDDETGRMIIRDSIELTDHFAEKVRQRAAEIRRKMGL
jgi:hypothetical protein